MKFNKNVVALAIMGSLMLAGCSSTEDTTAAAETSAEAAPVVAPNLTDEALLKASANTHTSYTVDGDAITIVFDKISKGEASSKWPGMKFHPAAGNWNWEGKTGLVFKLENKGSEEARIEIKVADSIGIMGAAAHQLDLPVYLPAGEVTTIEYNFKGTEMGIEGYRGGKKLNLKKIPELTMYSVGPIGEQTITVHSVDFL